MMTITLSVLSLVPSRGVVVRERGGTPFRQIFFGAGTALWQISLATGGTLTLKHSGKSRHTVLNRSTVTLDQFIFWL